MATREHRLSEFRQDTPPSGQPLELLCEDHNGTYTLPYPCQWIDGSWCNAIIGAIINVSVIGWRRHR
ncbi:MAG: hypothetical protein P8Y71_20950 [Pseudolabrys sp.]